MAYANGLSSCRRRIGLSASGGGNEWRSRKYRSAVGDHAQIPLFPLRSIGHGGHDRSLLVSPTANHIQPIQHFVLFQVSILGKPDEFLAARALASHARCNSSFVQELFQGQTKLTLTCPLCRRECKTFDPYVCLSLPIPLKLKRYVPVHLVGLNGDNRQVSSLLWNSLQPGRIINHLP